MNLDNLSAFQLFFFLAFLMFIAPTLFWLVIKFLFFG